jgi:glycosyltransferase involved in cell wall biosynthesis
MPSRLVSIIIPVHNEEENLGWQYEKIAEAINDLGYSFEILYVDDGSTDDSLSIIKSINKKDKRAHYISFSRNFGKEAATSAGLRKSRGEAAIIVDADGQHPIENLLEEFLGNWETGYQIVIGVRIRNSKEGIIKRYGSKAFYKMLNAISEGETLPRSTDFRLLDRKVIDEFNKLTEHNRITRGMVDWLGFKRHVIEFEAPPRYRGTASYDNQKLIKLAFHAFVSQTTKPLKFTGFLGGIVTLASSLLTAFLIVEKYLLDDPFNLAVTGTAVLALFISFLVGLVLISNWLLALYIESIHNETQNRPLYIVDEEH